ncbi:MAG: RsmB/NOP family class I SAM-dependent RNA methyltransferase [Metallosphaera sp.]
MKSNRWVKSPSPTDECKGVIERALSFINNSSPEASFKRAIRGRPNLPGCYELYLKVLWSLPRVIRVYPHVKPFSREAVELALNAKPDPFSLPRWIFERMYPLLGDNGMAGLYSRRSWVRVNTLKGDRDEIIESLRVKGYSFSLDEDFDFLLNWISPKPSSTDEFREGLIIPQDKSSAIVVSVLNPKPGENILEIGGSPGGKTSLIQQITNNSSYVVSLDISEKRVNLQRRLLRLWGVENVDVLLADGSNFRVRKVDKILIDAPCSNSGTINVDPSIPFRLTKTELNKLVRIQREILKNAFSSGVEIVYSTCSLFPEEGEKQVEIYSKYLEKVTNDPAHFGYKRSKVWMRVMRTYPSLDQSEGFFISKIKP